MSNGNQQRNSKVVRNPIEVIWAGCKGDYGTAWQVMSLLLLIAVFSIGGNLWNGLQGRQCSPTTAAVDLQNADKTARFVGCGSRSILELIAGEGGEIENPNTPTPPPNNLSEVPE